MDTSAGAMRRRHYKMTSGHLIFATASLRTGNGYGADHDQQRLQRILNKGKPKAVKTADATDVAARYFVYKLYETAAGQPTQWVALREMKELRARVLRAVERGWVSLQGVGGRFEVALTIDGRRLARKGR